jgi:hypothetical protein
MTPSSKAASSFAHRLGARREAITVRPPPHPRTSGQATEDAKALADEIVAAAAKARGECR